MDATAIDHVNMGFPSDRLGEVIDFYVDRLGFETRFDDPREAVRDDPGLFPIFLGDGPRLYVSPTDEFEPPGGNFRHLAVRVPESPASVRDRLERADVEIDSVAERSRDAFGDYTSYYVSDPFGYTLEFMAAGDRVAAD